MTEQERFEIALLRVTAKEAQSIGTQSERALHRAIKYFLDPDEEHHEVPVAGFIADICDAPAAHIYEIQTRDFGRLREKISAFLPDFSVTVVFPVMRTKYLCWVDPETGEVESRRKSPRKGLPTDILPEMSALKDLMFAPGLDYLVILVDGEEYRLRDGWGSEGKRGSHCIGKTPFEYGEAVRITGPADLRAILPPKLSEAPFTRTELGKALKLNAKSGMKLSFAKNTLERAGVIAPIGKRGRETEYKIVTED